MPVPVSLLQSIARSALPILSGGAWSIAEIGSSIAAKVWEWWGKRKEKKERRAELEALAQATVVELRLAIREVVAEVAHGHTTAEQARLESYLLAVPAQIRRTLRRPTDVDGRTIPPDLDLARMEDIVPLLPPHPPRFAAGDRVADFELLELLGIGGFGEVWKARNAFMPGKPPVALKFCIDEKAAESLRHEPELLDRIQAEGKHPGFVQLLQTYLTAEPPFLEYELVEGGDLGGLIVEWHRKKGGPTATEAARLIQRLAEIVAFAHARGIIHRDLKPANILIQGDTGSSPQLKVADFGIGSITAEAANRAARLTGLTSNLTASAACGGYSLYYASPEQVRGAKADPRDDVHAIGVIWYQLIVGDLTAEAPRGPGWKKRLAARGMTTELIEFLEWCMATERDDRPVSAKEVAEQIELILADSRYRVPLSVTQKQSSPPRPVEPNPPDAVLPAETVGKVVETVSTRMRHRDKENRQKKFLEKLRLLLETLIEKTTPRKSRHIWRILKSAAVIIICGAVGIGAGAIADSIVIQRNVEFNKEELKRIASEHSTNDFTLTAITTNNYSSPGLKSAAGSGSYLFKLSGESSRLQAWLKLEIKSNYEDIEIDKDPYNYRYNYRSYDPYFDLAFYSDAPIFKVKTSPSAGKSASSLVRKLNDALTQSREEYINVAHSTYSASGLTLALSGIGGGGLAMILILCGWTYIRRRKARTLTLTVAATIQELEKEYPVDMGEFSRRVNLHDPETVQELIAQVEQHMSTR